MTDLTSSEAIPAPRKGSLLTQDARTAQRNAKEARFRMMGLVAVTIGVLSLVGLLTSILSSGLSSFQQTFVELEVYLDPAKLDKNGNRNLEDIAKVSTFGYTPLIEAAMLSAIERTGVTSDVADAKAAGELISKEAPASLRNFVLANPT
jgi:phosphate transport system permease protein